MADTNSAIGVIALATAVIAIIIHAVN